MSGPRAGGASASRILDVVALIPRGRVATYGQVAALAGLPRGARQVGWALAGLPDGSRVPWQRVIHAAGRISPRGEPRWALIQRALLEREGVAFDVAGRVDLGGYGWRPRAGDVRGRVRLR